MTITQLIVCIVAGLGAGLGTGLAGLSAAAVVSPMLITFLHMPAYQAIGIALASDVLASGVSAWTYKKNKNIDIRHGVIMLISVLIFTLVGSFVSSLVPNGTMGGFSKVMTLFVGLKFIIRPIMTTKEVQANKSEKQKIQQSILCGVVIGFICGFVGAGGGMMLLLVLTSVLGYELKTAVGTSVFIMTFTALTGAISHFYIGGAPDIPILIACVISTLVFAQIGAKWANGANVKMLNRVTGILLCALGVVMLFFELRQKVFDKNSVYLPTKKIGKNNPKAAEIEADNTARQEWNRTADLALISGIEEAKILEIKQTEIHDKAGQSIRENGWLPNLFRGIVGKAKEFLQAIIREKDMPPKPVLNMDMDEFRTMQTLMLKVQKQAKAIKKIQEVTLPNLRQQLAETTGIFKGKERKALEKQIQQIEAELDEKLDKLPDILTDDGYPDVQAFMKTYRKAEAIVTQYNQDLAEWEQAVKNGQKPAEKQHRPPERQSVRNRLRQLQEEGKQNSQPKQRKKSQDRDR